MTRILLYGGTFDPPHNGHMNNLRAAIAAVRPDRAIVMPAGIPPHKAASATPAACRLAMCACFRAVDPCVELSDWEIRREGRSYTVDTLEMLHAANPGAHLYLAVGSDMLLSFTAWRRWRDIVRLATLVVQSRLNGDAAALQSAAAGLRAGGARVVFAQAGALPCASREIRAGDYSAAELAALLPPSVRALIEQYGLYRATK